MKAAMYAHAAQTPASICTAVNVHELRLAMLAISSFAGVLATAGAAAMFATFAEGVRARNRPATAAIPLSNTLCTTAAGAKNRSVSNNPQ